LGFDLCAILAATEAHIQFASNQGVSLRTSVELIIEKLCLEDVAHADARVRRITKQAKQNRSPRHI